MKVAFLVPNKLGGICECVNRKAEKKKSKRKSGWGVKHISLAIRYATGVVHSIPLSLHGPDRKMCKC